MRWGLALGYRQSPGHARGHSIIEVDMLDPCFHLDPAIEGFTGMPFRYVVVHHDDLFREVVWRYNAGRGHPTGGYRQELAK